MAFDRFGRCSGCGHNRRNLSPSGSCRYAGSWAEKHRPACGHQCTEED